MSVYTKKLSEPQYSHAKGINFESIPKLIAEIAIVLRAQILKEWMRHSKTVNNNYKTYKVSFRVYIPLR